MQIKFSCTVFADYLLRSRRTAAIWWSIARYSEEQSMLWILILLLNTLIILCLQVQF